jgi:DNA-binding transcriptional MerR regulator
MRKKDMTEAIRLRKEGRSYDEIKSALKISKSTLSCWLREHPLSSEQSSELRGRSKRIESFRETARIKRQVRQEAVNKSALQRLGVLSGRDIFIAGLALYWGEGYKTAEATTALANTDPAMCKFFIRWLKDFGISKEKLRVRLQLYSDMNPKSEMAFWSKTLNLPESCFRKPYIKQTKLSDLSYRKGFKHGTCNVIYHNKPINQLVLSLVEHIRQRAS